MEYGIRDKGYRGNRNGEDKYANICNIMLRLKRRIYK